MVNLLLVSAQTEQSKGGIAVWTDMFLKEYSKFNINCDLLNIATIGVRSKEGNAKRNISDEFKRTRNIFRNLRKMLGAKSYDVAHINTSCGSFGLIRDYLTALKIKNSQPSCKIIVHFHCDIQNQCHGKISKCFLSKLLKISDRALVLNKKNYDFLVNDYNFNSEIVPNFITQDFVRTNHKDISPEISIASFVGYVRPEKGIKELYELAFYFPNISFRLTGEVHEDVLSWNKPDNVILCGKKDREGLTQELDKADIFMFLSHSEGFSVALLEAMSRGLPCVATDVGANGEMLENKGGLIVPVGNISEAIKAVEYFKSYNNRKSASCWNLHKVKNFYTTETILKRLHNIYES
mgnify:CR=1 FL=1